jgi:hypothetical protein
MQHCPKCGKRVLTTAHTCYPENQPISSYTSDLPTLRDLFAMAAMQGILSAGDSLYCFGEKELAEQSYKYSDEMMVQRNK